MFFKTPLEIIEAKCLLSKRKMIKFMWNVERVVTGLLKYQVLFLFFQQCLASASYAVISGLYISHDYNCSKTI